MWVEAYDFSCSFGPGQQVEADKHEVRLTLYQRIRVHGEARDAATVDAHAKVTGRVTGGDGRPTRLWLATETWPMNVCMNPEQAVHFVGAMTFGVETDDAGQFVFGPIPPGTYVLYARDTDNAGVISLQSVEVADGDVDLGDVPPVAQED